MQVLLETERLVLRRFTVDDVDHLVALAGEPEVKHFITGGRATSREEIENDVLPAFLRHYERFAGYGFWAAIEKATGEFLGWFHFRPASGSPADEPELGYRLRRSAWGQGYTTEGPRADPQGLRRARRAARGRVDDGCQRRLPRCDGEGGPDSGAQVPPRVA